MLELTYIGEENKYKVDFDIVSDNIVKIIGDLPAQDTGFILSRENEEDNWDYSAYTTVYSEESGCILFSNDGSTKPLPVITFNTNHGGTLDGDTEQTVYNYEDLEIPTLEDSENYEFKGWEPEIPESGEIVSDQTFTAIFEYVQTLKDVKDLKIEEVTAAHNAIVQNGVDVQLSDGKTEHFTLSERDQTYLMGLQTQVMAGMEQIPWHPSDTTEQCKYYSNADMTSITTTALQFITYHVTYLRALTIYINSLQTKEEVSEITYGSQIPEKYTSEPLKDMMFAITNA